MGSEGEGAPLLLPHQIPLALKPQKIGPGSAIGDAEAALMRRDAQKSARLAAQRRENGFLPRVDVGLENTLDLLVELLEISDGSRQPLQLAQVQACLLYTSRCV